MHGGIQRGRARRRPRRLALPFAEREAKCLHALLERARAGLQLRHVGAERVQRALRIARQFAELAPAQGGAEKARSKFGQLMRLVQDEGLRLRQQLRRIPPGAAGCRKTAGDD